jgi:hypothetical protein
MEPVHPRIASEPRPRPEASDPGEQRAYIAEHVERSHEPQGGRAERHDDRRPTQDVRAVRSALRTRLSPASWLPT